MAIPARIKKTIENLPTNPGIYKFLDAEGGILYVGKALNLHSRVKSYFFDKHYDRPQIELMLPLIESIETISTDNEIEALILEANLIKKYAPKYNTALKDDKRYAWIYIDTQNKFPRIKKVRDLGTKGRYFGPYPDGGSVNRMLRYIRKIYPYADCNLKFIYPEERNQNGKRNRCLAYYIGECLGPCDGLVSVQDHRKQINEIIKMLEGRKKSHVLELESKMRNYAKSHDFEKAAVLRDKVADLRYLSQKIDIAYGDTEQEFKKIQHDKFVAGITEAIERLGGEISSTKAEKLRVECYDISNISGQLAYGSMTVSTGPHLENSQYRIFKIQKKDTSDDPAMMREVLERRMRYLKPESKITNDSFSQKPGLIVIDGAKTQLAAVADLLPPEIKLIGISKGKHLKKAGQKQSDEFWTILPDGEFKQLRIQNPFIFQRLRDEAHRFAIKHHRNARKYGQKKSILDEIPGIGPKRKKLLMKKYGTIEKMREANTIDLTAIIKSSEVAKRLHDHLVTSIGKSVR